jgi:hypothetical protein
MWNGKLTPQPFSWRGWKTRPWIVALSTLTCAPSTVDRGVASWISSLAGAHAKIYPWPEREPVLADLAPASGSSTPESLARYDLATSSWRTSPRSSTEGSIAFSGRWPKSGTMRSGTAFPRPKSAPRISATDSFSSPGTPSNLLPTPSASSYGSNKGGAAGRTGPERLSLESMARRDMWPTPTASLGSNGGAITREKAREGGTLIEAVSARTLWPTPTVKGNHNRAGASSKAGDGLETAVGGSLNAEFCEWLMGYPIGWSDCAASATRSFREWCRWHGRSSSEESEDVVQRDVKPYNVVFVAQRVD